MHIGLFLNLQVNLCAPALSVRITTTAAADMWPAHALLDLVEFNFTFGGGFWYRLR